MPDKVVVFIPLIVFIPGDDDAPGCHQVLQAAGFPCQSGMMCNNLLFARV
jgi:hypothetical protein